MSRYLSRARKALRKKRAVKPSKINTFFFIDLTLMLLNSKKIQQLVKDKYRQIIMRRGALEFTFDDGTVIIARNEHNAQRKYNNLQLNNHVGIV